jgi:hypothetical protein
MSDNLDYILKSVNEALKAFHQKNFKTIYFEIYHPNDSENFLIQLGGDKDKIDSLDFSEEKDLFESDIIKLNIIKSNLLKNNFKINYESKNEKYGENYFLEFIFGEIKCYLRTNGKDKKKWFLSVY